MSSCYICNYITCRFTKNALCIFSHHLKYPPDDSNAQFELNTLVIEFLQLQIWLPELSTSLFLHLLNMSSQYRLVGHSLLPLWTQKQIYLSSPLILSSKWYYLEIQIRYILAYTLSVVCRQHPDINLSARPSVISLRSDLSLYALSISHCRWSHLLLYFTNWGSRKCHWFCFVAFIRQFQNWSCFVGNVNSWWSSLNQRLDSSGISQAVGNLPSNDSQCETREVVW